MQSTGIALWIVLYKVLQFQKTIDDKTIFGNDKYHSQASEVNMIRVAKWNGEIDYERLKYPGIEYVNGIDLGDTSKSAFMLLSMDIQPPAITMNLWHDSIDQGVVQNSLEWELPEFHLDKDVEYIHLVLFHISNLIYPNGFERMDDKEMVNRLTGLAAIIEIETNQTLRDKLKNVQG